MIVGVIGTPSPLTYITTNILRAIVQVTHGEHQMIGANSVADLREAWPASGEAQHPIVVASDMPRDDFAGFLLKSGAPTVLCVERLDDICNYMVTCRGFDGLAAIRVGTQSLSNLEALAIEPRPGLLRVTSSTETFSELVSRLLRFLRIERAHDTAERAAAHLGFANAANMPFSDFLAESGRSLFPNLEGDLHLSPEDFDALDAISRSYNVILGGRRIEEAYWAGYCFLEVNTPGIPVKGSLNLEGRARFLTYGPYFHLPHGTWAVEVMMDIYESLSENRVGFDVHAGSVLAACTTTLPASGGMACDMVFKLADSNVPIEIRVQLLTGAIEGKLRLRGARFRRI